MIVAGGRKFTDYELLKRKLDYYFSKIENVEIVSGKAIGADRLGERYAKERGLKCQSKSPNWTKYPGYAGYVRNKEMAEYADALVAFWDGKSKGTKDMIDLAKERQLAVRVVLY